MSVSINEATGEVTFEVAGKTFRLHGSMERMADLERALGASGLPAVGNALAKQSAETTLKALQTLCVSGNEAEFKKLSFGAAMPVLLRATFAAVRAALPEEDEERGNAETATQQANGQLRGGDTVKSLTAS